MGQESKNSSRVEHRPPDRLISAEKLLSTPPFELRREHEHEVEKEHCEGGLPVRLMAISNYPAVTSLPQRSFAFDEHKNQLEGMMIGTRFPTVQSSSFPPSLHSLSPSQ